MSDLGSNQVEALCATLRKYNVRAFNGFGLEIVFEPASAPEKEKPTEAPPAEGSMPTRAEIEESMKRIREGGLK